MDLSTSIVAGLAVIASWDALRRMFIGAKFNRETLERVDAIAREQEAIKTQVQGVKERLTLQAGSISTRNPLRQVQRP